MFGWLQRRRKTSRPSEVERPFDMTLFDGPQDQLFAALASHWAAAPPHVPTPPDSEAMIRSLEARTGLRLPEDFRAYLRLAAPGESYWDDFNTLWWSIADLKTIPEECGDPPMVSKPPAVADELDRYLIFADYMIWCYAWAICCSEGPNRGRIILIDDPAHFVADNFRDFLALTLTDAPDIHPGAH